MLLKELVQVEILSQGGGEKQAGIGDEGAIIEGDVEAVESMRRWHRRVSSC